MEKYYDEAEKLKYIRGFKNCNLTLLEYCDKMQIRYDDMKSWLKQYKNLPKFGKINVQSIMTKKETTVKTTTSIKFESETIKIELQPGYDKQLLQQMVEVMIHAK